MNTTLKLRIIAIVMLGIPLALTAVGVSFYQYRKQVVTTMIRLKSGIIKLPQN